jgi:type IV pilus assembly protein PilW
MKQHSGFTLIELMVASLLSIMILGGVLTLMSSNKRTYTQQADQAELQENARFALQFITRGLRMGGYFGCTNKPIPGVNGVTGLDEASDDLFGATRVAGWSGPAEESDVFGAVFMDTDRNAFRIVHCPRDPNNAYTRRTRYQTDGTSVIANPDPLATVPCGDPTGPSANFQTTPLQQTMTTFNMNGFDSIIGNLSVGDTVVASDCVGSDLYTVNAVNASSITLDDGLRRDYENGMVYYGAEMRRLTVQRFFVAENDQGEYSLYRDNAGGYDPDNAFPNFGATPNIPDIGVNNANLDEAEELVSGIESMQLRWGEDTDGDLVPDIYTTSNAVADWNNVGSVRITLLMRTPLRSIDPDTRSYTIDAASASGNLNGFVPNDTRRRVVITNTLSLRNNVLIPQ